MKYWKYIVIGIICYIALNKAIPAQADTKDYTITVTIETNYGNMVARVGYTTEYDLLYPCDPHENGTPLYEDTYIWQKLNITEWNSPVLMVDLVTSGGYRDIGINFSVTFDGDERTGVSKHFEVLSSDLPIHRIYRIGFSSSNPNLYRRDCGYGASIPLETLGEDLVIYNVSVVSDREELQDMPVAWANYYGQNDAGFMPTCLVSNYNSKYYGSRLPSAVLSYLNDNLVNDVGFKYHGGSENDIYTIGGQGNHDWITNNPYPVTNANQPTSIHDAGSLDKIDRTRYFVGATDRSLAGTGTYIFGYLKTKYWNLFDEDKRNMLIQIFEDLDYSPGVGEWTNELLCNIFETEFKYLYKNYPQYFDDSEYPNSCFDSEIIQKHMTAQNSSYGWSGFILTGFEFDMFTISDSYCAYYYPEFPYAWHNNITGNDVYLQIDAKSYTERLRIDSDEIYEGTGTLPTKERLTDTKPADIDLNLDDYNTDDISSAVKLGNQLGDSGYNYIYNSNASTLVGYVFEMIPSELYSLMCFVVICSILVGTLRIICKGG